MNLGSIRYNHDEESTQSILSVDGAFECHVLEDQRQIDKVSGETRIPEGTYEIGFKETLTPLTEKYRAKFNWFDQHLEIKDVPEFENVYIHIGNSDKHTEGCLLVADRAWNDPNDYNAYQSESTPAFARLYQRITSSLISGEKVTLTIKSIWE